MTNAHTALEEIPLNRLQIALSTPGESFRPLTNRIPSLLLGHLTEDTDAELVTRGDVAEKHAAGVVPTDHQVRRVCLQHVDILEDPIPKFVGGQPLGAVVETHAPVHLTPPHRPQGWPRRCVICEHPGHFFHPPAAQWRATAFVRFFA